MTRKDKIYAVKKFTNFLSELEPDEIEFIELVTEGIYLTDIPEIEKWAEELAEDDDDNEIDITAGKFYEED